MSTAPLVTIVVPSRGGSAHLPVLFDALQQQDSTSWEAVVVLDGDIDGSEAVVRRAAEDLPVSTVVFPENRGRSAALNAGFEAARGDVLVRCDDDMVPGHDYVRRHGAAHDGRDVGVVGLARNIYPDTAFARAYGRSWDERFRREAYALNDASVWHYWAGNCSVTRDLWDKIGPYDSTFRAYGWEDVDWGYRLHLAGVPVFLDPALEIEHHGPAATAASRAQKAYYAGAAKHRFEAKHGFEFATAPLGRSAWGVAVDTLQRHLDETRTDRLGTAVDRVAGVMPRPIAQKAIALLVEASSRAGNRVGAAGNAV